MQTLKKAYYRTFQAVFNIGARFLPWRKPERAETPGCISQIPDFLNRAGAVKPLIVTGPNLAKLGFAARIISILDEANIPYGYYDNLAPNPTVDMVEAVREVYLREGCDSFIALGGGSNMDTAKAAAARIVRPNRSVNRLGGLLRVLKRIPPFIAIPTTAGSGSETTIAALITDPETQHKYALMDLCLIPRYAVLDAELTTGLSPYITATTGMDALTHAIEAYLCWTYNTKESLRFAEEATKLIFENLEKAYNNGQDITARQNMMIASFKAGFAFTRAGVGNVHAIAHTLGGIYNTAHGLANAVILPVVLEEYGSAVYGKLSHLAEITGVKTSGSEEEKAKAFIAEIYAMNKRMGIPSAFDFIKDEDIPRMVKWAYKETNPIYPVPVLFNEEKYAEVINKIRA